MNSPTTTVTSILDDLEAVGVAITLDGSDLVLKPRGRVSADLLGRIKASKDLIVRHLIHRRILDAVAAWKDEGWREYFYERAGTVEDASVPRDLADEAAFHQTIAFVLEEHGIGYEPLSIPTSKLLWVHGKASQFGRY